MLSLEPLTTGGPAGYPLLLQSGETAGGVWPRDGSFTAGARMAVPFPLNPIHISWVTFGVINVPATLVALRLIKPAFMAKFRHDVLDYAVTAGFIGAAAMAFVYGYAFITSDHHLEQARSVGAVVV